MRSTRRRGTAKSTPCRTNDRRPASRLRRAQNLKANFTPSTRGLVMTSAGVNCVLEVNTLLITLVRFWAYSSVVHASFATPIDASNSEYAGSSNLSCVVLTLEPAESEGLLPDWVSEWPVCVAPACAKAL